MRLSKDTEQGEAAWAQYRAEGIWLFGGAAISEYFVRSAIAILAGGRPAGDGKARPEATEETGVTNRQPGEDDDDDDECVEIVEVGVEDKKARGERGEKRVGVFPSEGLRPYGEPDMEGRRAIGIG